MSLVSQITAAFQQVATTVGAPKDWAGQFNGALTTQTGAQAASKTVPGVVQLATTAQAVAGTDDQFAVTSLGVTSALRSAPTLASNTNYNTLLTTGNYSIPATATNGPSADPYLLEVTASSDGLMVWQKANLIETAGVGRNTINFFSRAYNGTAWSAWARWAPNTSPTLTGTPNTTTPTQNDNGTRIPTTAWVQTNSGIRVPDFTTLGSLYSGTTRPPVGSLIYVGACTDGGFTHLGSEWRVATNGQFSPVANVPMLLSNVSDVNSLTSIYNSTWKNSFALFEHRVTSVSITAPTDQSPTAVGNKWEYRWDSIDLNAFHLWPTADTFSSIYYGGTSDISLYGNGYTVVPFDTWDFNGLNLTYGLGTAPNINFSVPAQGRYEFVWGVAVTNDDTTERYLFTTYNATRGIDFQTGSPGLYADRPFQQVANHWCGAGDQIRFAIFRSGNGNQWMRRGSGTFAYARPRGFIKYLGWK